MYYCPKCKKKFRQYRRRCPDCNVPCRNSDHLLIRLIVICGVILVGLLAVAMMLPKAPEANEPSLNSSPSSVNSSSVAESSGTPDSSPATIPTELPPTSAPVPPTTAPVPPTTSPSTNTGSSGIGLYTRAQLEAMDKTYSESGFGAGRAPNHARPSIPVAEQKKYSQYDAYFIAEDTNAVYLTFDCGYEYYATDSSTGQKYPVTARILDVLKEKGVKAVFFITMDYVKAEPGLVQRMIDEGHAVGNHTVYHPVMPSKSIDRMEKEVMDLHNYILEKYDYTMTLFRPPTGAYSVQSLAVVQNLGYKSVLWSFQYYDYDPEKQPSETSAYKTITDNTHNGCIFLLHAVSETNAAVLGDVIDYLRTNNYTIPLFS